MAEQSMFWPTTGTGDGISGGYTSDRLAAIWDASIGEGVLYYLNELEATGIGTTSLLIDTGAAVVNGYLYQNTSSATIATATLGSATFGLYIIANESASAVTVNRSVSGTTVASKTVRLALNSTTPSQPHVQIASVTTVAGSITAIDAAISGRPALSRAYPFYEDMAAVGWVGFLGTISVPNNTLTVLDNDYVLPYSPSNRFLDYDSGSGTWTVLQDGNYALQIDVTWDTNTTNRRRILIDGTFTMQCQYTAASFIHTTNTVQTLSAIQRYQAGNTITPKAWQDSGTTRTISEFICKVIRF